MSKSVVNKLELYKISQRKFHELMGLIILHFPIEFNSLQRRKCISLRILSPELKCFWRFLQVEFTSGCQYSKTMDKIQNYVTSKYLKKK